MNNSIAYANILSRVKATIIDSIILITLSIVVTELFSFFENVPDQSRIIAFVLIFILYDPLFTSLNGATLGHSFSGIKVRKHSSEKKINFFNAVLRYLCKISLGWLSLLTVTGDPQKRALHDLAARSIVVQNSQND